MTLSKTIKGIKMTSFGKKLTLATLFGASAFFYSGCGATDAVNDFIKEGEDYWDEDETDESDIGTGNKVSIEMTAPDGKSFKVTWSKSMVDFGQLEITEDPDSVIQPIASADATANIEVNCNFSSVAESSNDVRFSCTSSTGYTTLISLPLDVQNPVIVRAGNFIGEEYGTMGQLKLYSDDYLDVESDTDEPNTAPTISGSPTTEVEVDSSYSFAPISYDADMDSLTFGISNKPSWATFSTTTGELSGTTPSSEGTTSSISIYVTDGEATTYLSSFNIDVVDTFTNNEPVISGVPTTQIDIDTMYDFTPNSSDADGDPLTFGIANKPSWATFNTSTGRLSGVTPTTTNTYLDITIYVNDGTETAYLPTFNISVNDAP